MRVMGIPGRTGFFTSPKVEPLNDAGNRQPLDTAVDRMNKGTLNTNLRVTTHIDPEVLLPIVGAIQKKVELPDGSSIEVKLGLDGITAYHLRPHFGPYPVYGNGEVNLDY